MDIELLPPMKALYCYKCGKGLVYTQPKIAYYHQYDGNPVFQSSVVCPESNKWNIFSTHSRLRYECEYIEGQWRWYDRTPGE